MRLLERRIGGIKKQMSYELMLRHFHNQSLFESFSITPLMQTVYGLSTNGSWDGYWPIHNIFDRRIEF